MIAIEKAVQFFNLGDTDDGFPAETPVYPDIAESHAFAVLFMLGSVTEGVVFNGLGHYPVTLRAGFSCVFGWCVASFLSTAFTRCVFASVGILSAMAAKPSVFYCLTHGVLHLIGVILKIGRYGF